MGISAGDLARIKRELGMVEGHKNEAGAFYKIQSAWLRELIHENAALHKIVADYHCGGTSELGLLRGEVKRLKKEVERLRQVALDAASKLNGLGNDLATYVVEGEEDEAGT